MKNLILICAIFYCSTIGLFSQITWTKHVISNLAFGPHFAISSDINGDGDLDVLAAIRSGNKVVWYDNSDANGNFSVEQVISGYTPNVFFAYAIDIDGDSVKDVISVSAFDNKIAWYKNTNGLGTFGTQNIINDTAMGATAIYSCDLDGDNDNDVVYVNGYLMKISWQANDGIGNFGLPQVISNDYSKAIFAIDIDNDGDNDIISSSSGDGKLSLFRNNGTGLFSTAQTITNLANVTNSIYACDLDGDGDNDILITSATNNKVSWFRNDGTGNFSSQLTITSLANYAYSVYACDIDGDGDLDVLSASQNDNKIAWYENLDGNGTFGSQQIISTNSIHATSVYACDFDGDGDNDVLATSTGDSTIAWYENIGLTNILENNIICKVFPNPTKSKIFVQADNIENIEIINSVGISINCTNFSKEINLELLPKGIYIIKILTSYGLVTKKIILE